MKILVTGAYGQLGSEIKELEKHFPNYHFIFTDIDVLDITCEMEVEDFFNENRPDFTINCAAYTAVDKAETEQGIATNINAKAPGILAKCSKQFDAKIIQISTDYVFDGDANQPYSESDEVNPQGVYGKTKLQGELNCLKENLNSVIIRTSWLYSGFGNNFVKTMIRLGSERDSLNVVFDQIGTPTYAADLARAILSVIQVSEKDTSKFIPGIYHYSNQGVASWYDFAKAILEISETDCIVNPVLSDQFPTPAKRPHFSVLSKSKIRDNYGIEIPYWRDSLKECILKLNN